MTWFYPLSFFSAHKSFTYTPDSFLEEAYVKNLNDFKKSYSKNSQDDVTAKLTPSVLQMYEQNWLVNKDPVIMNDDEFDSILLNVKGAKGTLLRLTVQEKYTGEQRQYLLDCIKNLLSLEETISTIKNDKWESRSTQETIFHNLQMAFDSSLNIFIPFYELSQSK